ncbi:hypothetical protein J6590_093191 [Homalodisca vitripennis]|nr:hypothetical protein J6590_029263 [Homalodisca vitripennis]KAG8289978.1 hypothetical protein J6590_093191 [Homalodisca vitripennis]
MYTTLRPRKRTKGERFEGKSCSCEPLSPQPRPRTSDRSPRTRGLERRRNVATLRPRRRTKGERGSRGRAGQPGVSSGAEMKRHYAHADEQRERGSRGRADRVNHCRRSRAQGHPIAVQEPGVSSGAEMWIARLVKFRVLTRPNNKACREMNTSLWRSSGPGRARARGGASHRSPAALITRLVLPPGPPLLYIYYNLVIKICLAAEHLFLSERRRLRCSEPMLNPFLPNKQSSAK